MSIYVCLAYQLFDEVTYDDLYISMHVCVCNVYGRRYVCQTGSTKIMCMCIYTLCIFEVTHDSKRKNRRALYTNGISSWVLVMGDVCEMLWRLAFERM